MKVRVDVCLVERGLAESRTRAQALILAGRVYAGERRLEKPGMLIPADSELSVRGVERYVSRGGLKLEGALRQFAWDPRGSVAVDVGASTGGFTDCLLQHGATRVYAVDVGHGQLAEKLRTDPRVVNLERTNARSLTHTSFPEPIHLIVVDASFIGLEKLVPALARVARAGTTLIALIKPQFEAGREEASRGRGVIRDPQVREAAIAGARTALVRGGFEILAQATSEVHGPKGNVEEFVLARRDARPAPPDPSGALGDD
jgi:23S rRNA (cytidine1920-2'-O)/16S rRNA (cytidine1409-2'-O)-methyltransferase